MMGRFPNLAAKAFAWRPSLNITAEGPVIPPYLIAMGLSSGVVKLTSLRDVDPRQDHFSLNRKELISHANKFSAFLHWNPWRTSLLAQGIDRGKHNRTPSVLVWDVIRETCAKDQSEAKPNTEFSNSLPPNSLYNMDKVSSEVSAKGNDSLSFCDRPLCDACLNENVISFAWVSINSFVVGLATRHIKLYDISDTAKTIQMTQTKMVYGLTSDPLFSSKFASFCHNQIALWTAENLEKPIYVFTAKKMVVCMKWSPLREGWLGVLLANSRDIVIYSTFLPFSRPMEESEQFLFEMRATISNRSEGQSKSTIDDSMESFVSFAWHGSIVNCIVTIDRRGCLNVAKVNDTTALTWSPNHTLLWCIGSSWLGIDRTGLFCARGYTTLPSSLLEDQVDQMVDGEAVVPSIHRHMFPQKLVDGVAQLALRLDANLDSLMQKRADAGYGLNTDATPYSVILGDDPHLRSLWIMIEYLQDCIESWAPYGKCQEPNIGGGLRIRPNASSGQLSFMSSPHNLRCTGALTILCGSDSTDAVQLSPSEVIKQADWHGIDARLPFPRYVSRDRSRVLRMCMWPLDAPQDVQRKILESICSDLEFERAAAMALINLQFDWTLSFLSRASEHRRAKEAELATSREHHSTGELTSAETDLVKLAISGFSDTQNDVWGSGCADILSRLNNPYLRLIFKFLTTARGDFNISPDFSEILENESLFLIDRLTFACLYLSDEKLQDYVLSITNRMILEGRLEAILLTGLSTPYFFDLLQNYVDLTFDVQTAAILGLHACYLCRRAAPPPSLNPPPPTPFLNTPGGRSSSSSSTNQNRLRFRSMREAAVMAAGASSSRMNQTASSSSPSLTQPADQVVANMGGRRLANWVETYRDMLDRWRMWFYRVDFDNHYKTRLITPLLGYGVKATTISGSSGNSSSGGPTVSTSSPSATMKEASASVPVLNKSIPANTPVRGIGLPAGSSQIFASCIYCGWRLGGVIRSSTEDASSNSSMASAQYPQSSFTPTFGNPPPTGIGSATSSAAAAVAAAGASGGSTTMHAGGGKQTICWHCLKPLPRCSICLMHMGSEVGGCSNLTDEVEVRESASNGQHRKRSEMIGLPLLARSNAVGGPALMKMSVGPTVGTPVVKMTRIGVTKSKKPEIPGGNNDASRGGPLHLSSWFVWCQACRHGGHAGHIFNWFYGGDKTSDGGFGGDVPLPSDLIECPVNGCSCHCASLDATIPPPRHPPSPPPEFLSADANAVSLLTRMRDLKFFEAAEGDSEQGDSEAFGGDPPPAFKSMNISQQSPPVIGGHHRQPTGTTPRNRREIVDPVLLMASMNYSNGKEIVED
nr:WD repeat containing protein mio [Hymenolepis microstoma]